MHVTGTATVAHGTLLVTTPARLVHGYLTPTPPDAHPLDSRRAAVAPLCAHQPGVDVEATKAAIRRVAAGLDGRLLRRSLRAVERDWQLRLLHERYENPGWHLTGPTKEAAWTTKPVSTSTA
jgi:hypothetical protein